MEYGRGNYGTTSEYIRSVLNFVPIWDEVAISVKMMTSWTENLALDILVVELENYSRR